MSRPVRRVPGAFYLWTRCVDRQEFRLRPGQSFDQTVGLLIADAAQDHGVQVVQLVVMSNHLHAVLWDPRGVVSEFAQQALANIGRMVNKAHKRGGHFWDRHDGNELKEVGDLDALIHYVAYCYLNPTRAELVAHPSAWPGINTDPADIGTGKARVFERDDSFFRADGPVPRRAELRLELPPGIDAAAFRARVLAKVKEEVDEIRARVHAEGRSFLGVEADVEKMGGRRRRRAQGLAAGERRARGQGRKARLRDRPGPREASGQGVGPVGAQGQGLRPPHQKG